MMEWTLEVVVVPVSDVDRAKQFYAEGLGFKIDHDTKTGAGRFVQLTPHGSGCSIVLSADYRGMQAGSLKGLQLVVSDIEAAHRHLSSNGVTVSPIQHYEETGLAEGRGGDWNSFIFFDDPDGNAWAVQERPAAKS